MNRPERGDVVRWAEAEYLVAERNGDLLVLDGVATRAELGAYTCRERVTVLETDVRLVGQQLRLETAL